MLIVLLFCTVELLNNIVVHECPVRDRTIRTRALQTLMQPVMIREETCTGELQKDPSVFRYKLLDPFPRQALH